MLDTIKKELAVQGIKLDNNDMCTCAISESPIRIRQANKEYLERSRRNRLFMLTLWHQAADALAETSNVPSETYADLTRVFIESVRAMHDMAQNFPGLEQRGILGALQKAVDSDSASFSANAMNKVIDLRLSIDWVNHLINRDLYISRLFAAYILYQRQGKNVVAYGVDGFYSRLDLPMEERVFSFDSVEEDLRGRSRDIKNQRRYKAGLEGYDYPYVNEGFYWREIRNEPYSFDDEDNNPYPHRNVLWR